VRALSNKEIASILNLAEGTVKILCRNLKMEVARVLIAEEGRRALVENRGLRATVWPGA